LTDLLQSWPVLVDEWLACLEARGLRLAPEHAVTLLVRYRADPLRRARVAAAAGPLAAWLYELFPDLLGTRRPGVRSTAVGAGSPTRPSSPSASSPSAAPSASASDKSDNGLALPPDLAPLIGQSADDLAGALVEGLDRRRWVHRHRPLLVRLLCAVDPSVLPTVADRLAAGVLDPGNVALATDLAHLARTRADMLAELGPAPDAGETESREESQA
jgi:hypothetical protein